VAKKLNSAYALEGYGAAKQALSQLHRELMDFNPSAARSLGEGMEETLTVHPLHLSMQLHKTMASTNVIESALSIVDKVCRNVKRWHGGDQRERWVGSGLPVAEKQFRRVQGYKQIPILIRELEALTPNQSGGCQTEKGIVEWVTREPFNGTPGDPLTVLQLPFQQVIFPLDGLSTQASRPILHHPGVPMYGRSRRDREHEMLRTGALWRPLNDLNDAVGY
jgi:hypothetical protein